MLWKDFSCFSEECKCDSVLLRVRRAPVAVGTAAVSTEEMHSMKGRGVCVLHTYKDHLW